MVYLGISLQLSLFAEAFDEMLSSKYAVKVLSILTAKKDKTDTQACFITSPKGIQGHTIMSHSSAWIAGTV